MEIRGKAALREILAAEYALGTLRGAARRRFETWLRDDADLRSLVGKWNGYLVPLTEAIPAIKPSAAVWQNISRRIPALQPQRAELRWYDSLAFWRFFAGFSTAVAAVALVVAVPLLRSGAGQQAQPTVAFVAPAPQARPAYVATISTDKTNHPLAVMWMPASGNEVILKMVADDVTVPRDHALQLWMADPSGAPGVVSAGMVPNDGTHDAIRFSVPDAEHLRTSGVLAISLEPTGGSPKATHVLGFGKWAKVTS